MHSTWVCKLQTALYGAAAVVSNAKAKLTKDKEAPGLEEGLCGLNNVHLQLNGLPGLRVDSSTRSVGSSSCSCSNELLAGLQQQGNKTEFESVCGLHACDWPVKAARKADLSMSSAISLHHRTAVLSLETKAVAALVDKIRATQ
jgi:hypothetical protein